jgi:hypothetical protein
VTVGNEGGKWFVRLGVGVGIGGGLRVYPFGGFPSVPGGRKAIPRGFIGASASFGASVGPIGAEVKGEAGWVVTEQPDGRPQPTYIEQGTINVSGKNATGWGLSLGGGLNVFDIGVLK